MAFVTVDAEGKTQIRSISLTPTLLAEDYAAALRMFIEDFPEPQVSILHNCDTVAASFPL